MDSMECRNAFPRHLHQDGHDISASAHQWPLHEPWAWAAADEDAFSCRVMLSPLAPAVDDSLGGNVRSDRKM